MKYIIVALSLILTTLVLFSSCQTRQKCAAYGHYTYVEQNGQAEPQL